MTVKIGLCQYGLSCPLRDELKSPSNWFDFKPFRLIGFEPTFLDFRLKDSFSILFPRFLEENPQNKPNVPENLHFIMIKIFNRRQTHLCVSSRLEPDEAQRVITLNSALDISL
jgi:hypothetical protein